MSCLASRDDGTTRRTLYIAGMLVLSMGLSACNSLSARYSSRLRPLNIVTYVTTDNRVLKKKAHFGDKYSNVVTLTDDARDGLLPFGDEDGLIDQVSIEVYNRVDLGRLVNFVIIGGEIYTDHLSLQREKALRHINKKSARLLTEKFVGQNNYVKTASKKTDYEVGLKILDAARAEAVIEVDGQEARVKENVLQKVNGVYVMLGEAVHVGFKEFGDDINLGFGIIQIGNQNILLQEGQKTRITIDPAEARNHKLAKKEKINFVFVVGDTLALPDKRTSELEDIFHTFLVDHPDHQHVCLYRMIREMGEGISPDTHAASGFRMVDDPYAEPKPGNIATDIKDEIKDRMRDLYSFFYEVKDRALSFGGASARTFWAPRKK